MARAGHPRLDPHSTAFAALLGQINVLEHDAGNPLISAVVVSKDEMKPGVGFWSIAAELGYDVGADDRRREEFWLNSLKQCYTRWAD